MHTDFQPMREQLRTNPAVYACIGCLIVTHLILMVILVTSIASIAPEISTTLSDVQTLMPEMRRSLFELGQLVPNIKAGLDVLKQLCADNNNCHVHS